LNFFEAQDIARKNTAWLVVLFLLAVLALVALTYFLLIEVLALGLTGGLVFSHDAMAPYASWDSFLIVSAVVCLLIFSGSIYKTLSISSDGDSFAFMLGGRHVMPDTNDPQERQLINVVEEMSIAAGMTVPRVYLLDDLSINAFAAGMSPADAVIGVTRGTMSRLNRDELQGVIAHEFSHIFNGDMRLNLRLIGVLHGILLIGLAGNIMLRTMLIGGKIRKSDKKRFRGIGGASLPTLLLCIGLIIIGYAGTFLGQLIKAMINRQREYLADSSAVQFTRNNLGISGALRKIGGANVGSLVSSPAAVQYSHGFFAEGINSFWQLSFATHPPLERRIERVYPAWDGSFLPSTIHHPLLEGISSQKTAENIRVAAMAAVLSSAEQAVSQIGTLNEANVEYVHELILSIPISLRQAAQNAFTARALVYAILISKQAKKKLAWSVLEQNADPKMPPLAGQYLTEIRFKDEKFILPLLELSINALRELSPAQFVQFKRAVHRIIVSDKRVNLYEWIIQRLVIQQLDRHFGFRSADRARYANLAALGVEVGTMLSLVAYAEHDDEAEAAEAFAKGAGESGVDGLVILPRKDIGLDALDHSLDRLTLLKPLVKPRFLKACMAIVYHDEKTTVKGIELVRTLSACLDCPMPPIRA